MAEKVFEVNPVAGTVRIAGFDASLPQGTFELEEFKQLCFQNNWEGTLAKVQAAEMIFEEVFMSIFYGPRWKEVIDEANRLGDITAALKRCYPDDWQKYRGPARRKAGRGRRKKAVVTPPPVTTPGSNI